MTDTETAVQLQLAEERVRAEALSMRSTDDLVRVVAVMLRELKRLGVNTPAASIGFMNAETESSIWYTAFRPSEVGLPVDFFQNMTAVDDEIAVKVTEYPFSERSEAQLAPWRRQEQVVARESLNHDAALEMAYSNHFMPREDATQEQKDRFLESWLGEWIVTRVPHEHGIVSIRDREYSEEHAAFIRHLAAGLSLGYFRFLDFQRLEEQNRALEEANRQIEEATRLKSDFLARMSHDLRTPMNAIIGYTRILLRQTKDKLDERQYRNLSNIQISADNLLDLINDILDLSRVEAGRIELHTEQVDLKRLATECFAPVETLARPGVKLEQQLNDATIRTDPDRLRRVVMNLLGNALKFTENGHIRLSLTIANGGVELSVADTGVGIPAEELPHIFEEFRQVEGEGGKTREGSGLGLSIAKKSVELLGGTIAVESEVGQGTTFTIRIPEAESAESPDSAGS